MLDGILLIKHKGKTSVVDNIANAIDVVFLPCFVFHYLEEGLSIWLSLDSQLLLINAHELPRDHYVLAHLQWNNSVVVDKIVLSDD